MTDEFLVAELPLRLAFLASLTHWRAIFAKDARSLFTIIDLHPMVERNAAILT